MRFAQKTDERIPNPATRTIKEKCKFLKITLEVILFFTWRLEKQCSPGHLIQWIQLSSNCFKFATVVEDVTFF